MTRAALALAVAAARGRWRRWLPFVVVVAVGIAVVAATNGVATRASDAASESADRDGAGRVVEVEVDAVSGTSRRLTRANLARMERIPGVQRVLPDARVAIGIKTEEIPGVLFSGHALQTARPPLTGPGSTRTIRPGEVLVPARAQGSELAGIVGRRLPFEAQRTIGVGRGEGTSYALRTVGTYDGSFQVDGPDVAYLHPRDVLRLAALANGVDPREFEARIGYDDAEVVVTDQDRVPDVLRQVQALGLPATTLGQRYAQLPSVLDATRLLGQVLGAILVVVIGLAAAGQTSASVRARWTEIGVLRAFGFTRAQATLAFAGEAVLALLAGLVAGTLLAIPAAAALVSALGDSARVAGEPVSSLPAAGPLIVFAGLTLVAGTLGAIVAAGRGARKNPSLVLRGA